MLELFDFVSQNWILAAIWVGFLVLLIVSESARGGKSLSPQQATTLINTRDAVVVDVRKSDEFGKGHLPSAINIPSAKIKDRLGELEKHKEKPIIVVCQLGQSAGAAGAELRKAGFNEVYRLKGGVAEWRSSRMPLVKK
ncbi:MAG: rhodanese-like domain-containing protein [Natronospirillum sp.]